MEFNATFLVSAISLIVFSVLMNKVLYAPLEKIVSERERFINGNYSDAKNADEKASTILQEVADKIAASRIEAKLLNDKKLQVANEAAVDMVKDAKSEMDKFVQEQKCSINNKAKSIVVDKDELAEVVIDKLLGDGGANG